MAGHLRLVEFVSKPGRARRLVACLLAIFCLLLWWNSRAAPNGDVARYVPHPPGHPVALAQRLWLALVLGRSELLREPEASFVTDHGSNREVLLALRSSVLGEAPLADEDTLLTLKYFQQNPPQVLARALQTRLAAWCWWRRSARPFLCPMDAGATFYPDASGKLHCPHELEPSHETGSSGLSMLLDGMSRMRARDRETLRRLGRYGKGTSIVDIGAGVGAYTFPLAGEVGPTGRVYAVDIQEPLVGFMQFKAREQRADNVRPILSTVTDIKTPAASVDLALIIDVPASYGTPYAFFTASFSDSIRHALRPHGALLIVGSPPQPRAQDYAAALDPHGFKLQEVEKLGGREYVLLRLVR